ncbi:MAG: AraC family transcriptional regulator [Spirochaetota bacterium]
MRIQLDKRSIETIEGFRMSTMLDLPLVVHCFGSSRWYAPFSVSNDRYDAFSIEYVTAGEGELTADGKRYPLRPGDVFLLHRGGTHAYRALGDAAFRKIWMRLSGPLAEYLIKIHGLSDVHHVPACMHMKDIFTRMRSFGVRAHHTNAPGRYIADGFSLILHEMLLMLAARLDVRTVSFSADVVRMKNYLDAMIEKDVRLADVASRAGKSASQTIRKFKRELGTTPYQYLLSRKMELAEYLLANTGMNVREVARETGFADEQYFSRAFKARTRRRPSEVKSRRIEHTPGV